MEPHAAQPPLRALFSDAVSGVWGRAMAVFSAAPARSWAGEALTASRSMLGSAPSALTGFLNTSRSLPTMGTGQTQAQKARPISRMAATASTSEMTAWGMRVFEAIMVPSAPRGHSREMSFQPMADRVPMPELKAKPAPIVTISATGMTMRSFLVFMGPS